MTKSLLHKAVSSASSADAPAQRGRHFRPDELRYSWRWAGAGAVLGALGLLGVWQGGAPVAAGLALAGIAGLAYARLVEPARPRCEHVTLHVPNLPPALAGLRIAQLSDMHLGNPYSSANTRWSVDQVMHARPDLVVLTGDFVSYSHAIAELPTLLRNLHAPLGVYAVPGNHDYLEGLPAITSTLAGMGIEMLLNEHRLLSVRGSSLALIGVDDVWYGTPDLDAALAGVPADVFTLLLAHAPDFADEAAQRHIAVQLSGHTHGGQLRLPLLGAFCLPLYGLRYSIGLEQVGQTQVYISRGIGGMPLRFRCSPETTVFTLASA